MVICWWVYCPGGGRVIRNLLPVNTRRSWFLMLTMSMVEHGMAWESLYNRGRIRQIRLRARRSKKLIHEVEKSGYNLLQSVQRSKWGTLDHMLSFCVFGGRDKHGENKERLRQLSGS